jgi:small subunit ribosomal protein S6
MPLYEHVFLARQDVSNQQVETMTKDFQGVIEAGGGKVVRAENWGIRTLAYKIKKNRKAHYTYFAIEAPHAAVAEMERQMSISADVLRFLTVRVDEHESEPTAMMRKSDRDDRRGGPGGARGGREREGGGFRGDREGGFRGRGREDRPPRDDDRRGLRHRDTDIEEDGE